MDHKIMDDLVRQAFGRPREKTAAPWGKILAGGAAALGLGGVAAGHMRNSALSHPGSSVFNPFTWGGGSTKQQAFDYNKHQYDAQSAAANTGIDRAMMRGEDRSWGQSGNDEADRLQGQLDNRSFDGNSWWNPRLGGLNPFANGTMGQSQSAARGIQDSDRGQLERMRARMAQRSGQMSPDVQRAMDSRMNEMRGRVDQDWTQAPGGSTPNGSPGAPPLFHQRPVSPQELGHYLNPHDYRQSPAPPQVPWLDYAASSPLNIP